jgi:hypothetical protein
VGIMDIKEYEEILGSEIVEPVELTNTDVKIS